MKNDDLDQKFHKNRLGEEYYNSIILAISIAVILTILFTIGTLVPTFKTADMTGEYCLKNKINPNIAEAASLERLPGIGAKLAQKIVEYRNENSFEYKLVFRNYHDLEKVKGIGPKKTMAMSTWMEF